MDLYIYGSSEKFFEVQVFLFLFFSLICGDNAEIQSLHETPGCENKTKNPKGCFSKWPPGKLHDSRTPVSERFIVPSILCSPFLSSLSSRRKLILVISAHALNRKQ